PHWSAPQTTANHWSLNTPAGPSTGFKKMRGERRQGLSHEGRARASKTAAWSCGAAKDGSPRRQPWVQAVQVSEPQSGERNLQPITVCRDYSVSGTLSNSSANHWPERPAVLSRMALTCSALTSGALLPHSLRTYVNTSAIC